MSTYIQYTQLVNFRGFRHMRLDLHPQLNVFLGDNGSGKTSILQAFSILLSGIFPHCSYKPQIRALPYSSQNIRTWSERVKGKSRLVQAEVSACLAVLAQKENFSFESYALTSGVKTRQAVEIPELGSKEVIAANYSQRTVEARGIPVFAHYGPHRGAQQGERKRFSRRKVNYTSPFSAYINALQPSLDFDAFLDWFNEEEANELRERRHSPSFYSRELDAVRRALSKVLAVGDVRYECPRFETNPKRFVMTSVSADGAEAELQFDQLSDGYRGMIAMVADFARRLALANQYEDIDPLQGEGILLIDEVDAHLHPKWQYRVIDDLLRTFPNVQLIVTTHSPEVVSTVSKESVFILEPKNGILPEEVHPELQTKGYYPQRIAASVMGTPGNMETHPEFRAYLNCLAWIQSGNVSSADFENSLHVVTEHYGEEHPFTREIHSRMAALQRRQELFVERKRSVEQ